MREETSLPTLTSQTNFYNKPPCTTKLSFYAYTCIRLPRENIIYFLPQQNEARVLYKPYEGNTGCIVENIYPLKHLRACSPTAHLNEQSLRSKARSRTMTSPSVYTICPEKSGRRYVALRNAGMPFRIAWCHNRDPNFDSKHMSGLIIPNFLPYNTNRRFRCIVAKQTQGSFFCVWNVSVRCY